MPFPLPPSSLPMLNEIGLPDLQGTSSIGSDGPCIVILYNDDYHPIDQVVGQLLTATGYEMERCVAITLEAHTSGRAVAYQGSDADCERVAGILRRIRLQVETDRF